MITTEFPANSAGESVVIKPFAPLVGLLAADHTVLTTDPRGIHRSSVDDPDQDSTSELRADDLSRLMAHLDVGPAAVLGSSGGAVTALALAQAHPEQVHTVIAHEPPLIELLPDRAERHAGNEDVIARWLAGDYTGSWRAFFDNAGIRLPPGRFEAMFAGGHTGFAEDPGGFAVRLRPFLQVGYPARPRASRSPGRRARTDALAS
jgi:pimeloyl-ACP methyl ester carboxylesterase